MALWYYGATSTKIRTLPKESSGERNERSEFPFGFDRGTTFRSFLLSQLKDPACRPSIIDTRWCASHGRPQLVLPRI